MATERIDLLIEARNRASGALQDVNKQLGGLNKAAGVAAGGLGALAAAFAVDKILDFGQAIYGLAQQAASVGVLRESFQGLAQGVGQSSDTMLAALRSASSGMISDQNLMLAANKAMLLGVADTAEEMAGLLEVARTRGAAMGLDVTQAFDNIVTGLGRMSPLILDNLGITLDLDKTMGDYAKSVGKTAASLSDAERKQALVNRVMAESKGLMAGSSSEAAEMAGSFARAQASIDNMKVALGDLFGPAVAKVAEWIAQAAEDAKQLGENVKAALAPQTQTVFEQADAALARYNAAAQAWQQMLPNLPAGMVAELSRLLEAGATIDMVTGETAGYYGVLLDVIQAEKDWMAANAAARAAALAVRQTPMMSADGALVAEQMAAAEAIKAAYEQAAATQNAYASNYQAIAAAIIAASDGIAVSGLQVNSVIANAKTQFDILTASGYSAEDALRMVTAAATESLTAIAGAGSAAESAGASLGFFGLSAGNAVGPVGALGGAAAAAALDFVGLGNSAVDAANKINTALGAVAAASNLNKAKNTLAALQGPKQEDWSWPGLQVQLEGVGAKMGALNQHTLYMPRAMSAAGGGVSALNSEFSKLQSTVQSLLQQQLDPGVGVNPDDFLPRPDAINENARRLADIMVNGFKGQDWLSEFASEVPDIYQALLASGDPKATAAQLLKDFQAGLVPELIDKEAAKARVKEMLLGQENMAALANEIASELAAEMGISLGQAQQAVAQTLGMGAGGAAGTGLIPIDGAQSGAKMVDSLVLAIAERQSEIARSGELAGAQWGTAFLGVVESNVPITLLDILAQLVTPLVLALINAENSRKGAR